MQLTPTKAKAELCRRSLYRFVQEFWAEIIPEDPVWNWHIKYLCDELQKDILRVCRLPGQWFEGIQLPAKGREPKLHDDLINIPPGTSKSTIITVMAPAWVWTVDATIRTITASYSGDLAIDHAVKSRDIIQSEKYRKYFPEVEIRADHNNKSNYKNTKGGERYATSTGGTITGIHAHLILCDDLINAKQASSDSELEAACSFLDTTLSTRKVDKAVTLTVLVMQRLHEKDPAGNWLKKMRSEGKKVRHICLPATLQHGKDGTPNCVPAELAANYVEGLLDPVRMGKEVLDQMRVDLGSYGYSGQMQQDPSPAGGGIWKQWIIPVPDNMFPSQRELEAYGTDWDTAYTDKTTNAASAYVTSGRKDNKMYIDGFGWFYKEFPDLINAMKLLPDPHYIEAKASGKSAKQTLVTAGIPALEVQVNGDKMARARDATPKAEAGMVYCRQSLIDKLYNDPEQGILKFPNGLRQDFADTLAQAIQRHFAREQRTVKFGW
jgi:phage terminase large subunit-like protein